MKRRVMIGLAAVLGLCAAVGTFTRATTSSRHGAAEVVDVDALMDGCVRKLRSYAPPCTAEALDTPAERELFRNKYRRHVDRLTKRNPRADRDRLLAKLDELMENVDRDGRYTDPRPGRLEDARADWGRQEQPPLDKSKAGREFLERLREERAAQAQEEPPIE